MAKGSTIVDPGRVLAFNAGSRPFYFSESESGVAKAVRNIIMQSATMQTFITIPETTATGDFRITASVYFTGATQIIYGSSDSFNNRLIITSAGAVGTRIRNTSTTLSSADGAVPTNRNSDVSIERLGNTVTIVVNGTTVLTNTDNGNLGITTINSISRSATTRGDGFTYNLNFVSGFSINATYPLDDDLTTNVIRDTSGNNSNGTASASLSAQFSEPYQVIDVGFLQVANIVTNGELTTPSGWLTFQADTTFGVSGVDISVASPYSLAQVYQDIPSPGGEYVATCEVDNVNGTAEFTFHPDTAYATESGTLEVSAEWPGTVHRITLAVRGSDSATFSNVKAHRLLKNATPP